MDPCDHCQPSTFPCWYHYGEHERSQPPVRWVIEIAASTLKFQVASLPICPTFDEALRVEESARMLFSLLRQQWCNINRKPYNFDPHTGLDYYVVEETSKESDTVGRDLLKKLGLLPKVVRRL